jgi:plasmid stability protein
MAKRGRAPKGEYAGKTEVMSFRLTPDTKAALRRAAARSGRSLSQETEHRLRRGLDEEEAISSLWGDVKTSAMLRLAAQVVQSVRTLQDTKVHWTADAKVFDSAIEAIAGTLKLFRPLQAEGFSVGSPEIGAPALKVVEEAQATELSRPLKLKATTSNGAFEGRPRPRACQPGNCQNSQAPRCSSKAYQMRFMRYSMCAVPENGAGQFPAHHGSMRRRRACNFRDCWRPIAPYVGVGRSDYMMSQ